VQQGDWLPATGGYNVRMDATAKKLFEDALTLPDGERAELAASLIASLDQGADEDAQAAWDTEIARRVSELDEGSVRPVPWAEARRIIAGDSDEAPGS